MDKVRDRITFHIISHTHWDREWYLPFEVFRLELVELIDNLIDILEHDDSFIFHLDGQSIILQDYLEIKPEKREQIKRFVKSGNLLVGPWYVLSDQFLTSGEATIRNLLFGIRDAKQFGNVMMIGYLPDQFGQIAQLPQILKGFNIHSVIVGRGIQDSIAEHNWHGLNGDKVLAISLTHWYNNAQRLPQDTEKLHKYLDKIYETQCSTSVSGHILLMNGCDHLFPQPNLKEVLKLAKSNQKWQVVHDDLAKSIRSIENSSQVESYPIYFGELRDDNNKYILAGTLSSRVYLKLENYKCQTKLEKIIEPLSVFVETLRRSVSTAYPFDELRYAWRLLLQNHAHDSICGCSIDEVHREMETRFLKVSQVLEKLKENLLSHLCNVETPHWGVSTEGQYLQLINLTNYHRTDLVETEIEFPLGPPAEHPSSVPTINKNEINQVLLKKDGKAIDCEIIDSKQTFKMVRSKDEVPLLQAVQKVKLLFETDVKPFSVCSYEIAEERNGELTKRRAGERTHEFENQNYKLKVNQDGTVSILLKDEGFKFKDIHYFSVEDDLGDEYNFVPNVIARKDEVLTKQSHKSNMQSEIASVAEFTPSKAWGLPRNDTSKDWAWDVKVVEENKFRTKFLLSNYELPDLKIETEITCYRNSSRIDFKTRVDNHCKNKRIRLHFPTNLETNYITADTPFGVLQRARPPVDWTNYATSQPLHNWLDHNDEKSGLAFFGGGLADYELYEDGSGFAVTLIRAVEKLTSTKSHSLIETPDAQCNRGIEFSYAIYPHLGNWQDAKIQNEQLIFQTPIVVNQSNLNLDTDSLITASDDLITSSLKRAEDNENTYVLRLFNPFSRDLYNCKLDLNFHFKDIFLLNLNEEKLNTIKNKGRQISFDIKSFQVLTLGIEV